MNREVIEAIGALAKEKSISKEVLFSAIEEALKSAYKKNLKKATAGMPNVRVNLDREDGTVQVFARKVVVDKVTDDAMEISLSAARAIQPSYEAVSYTHLDVYKRQGTGRARRQRRHSAIIGIYRERGPRRAQRLL